MLNTANKMIDVGQIKKIHTLKTALKMTEKEYRGTLAINFEAASSKQLTSEQANSLITALEDSAIERGVWNKFEGKERFENLGHRADMAQPSQLRKIEALWRDAVDIRDHKKREKALRTFLDRHFKVSDLRFLDTVTTRKVIHTLNNMVRRKKDGARERKPDAPDTGKPVSNTV
ncbi:MAG: regulatory protein GemA [Nitrospirota bacterium]|nr:regulatory protein GemA [Nitrospirota bacterium]